MRPVENASVAGWRGPVRDLGGTRFMAMSGNLVEACVRQERLASIVNKHRMTHVVHNHPRHPELKARGPPRCYRA